MVHLVYQLINFILLKTNSKSETTSYQIG